MTKAIRVENADNSDHKVTVQVWEKPQDGGHAKIIEEYPLDNPTEMIESGQVSTYCRTVW